MSAGAPHPYRAALEARDPEALAAALHPDVTFTSPLVDVPLRGRDRVLALFGVLATVFEDVVFIDELYGDGTLDLLVRIRVDGHPIELIDSCVLDDDGRVGSITVLMRPLASVQALAARMVEPLAELLADQSADDARQVELAYEGIGETGERLAEAIGAVRLAEGSARP